VAGVGAVVVNVTATQPSQASFLTVWPSGAAQPNASNLNTAAGQTAANGSIVKLGAGGSIDIYNASGPVHVLVDVQGWFPADGELPAGLPRNVSVESDLPPNDPVRVGAACGIEAAMTDGRAHPTGPVTLVVSDNRDYLAARYSNLTGFPLAQAQALFAYADGVAVSDTHVFVNAGAQRPPRYPADWLFSVAFRIGAHEWFHNSQEAARVGLQGPGAPRQVESAWLTEAAADWFALDVTTNNGFGAFAFWNRVGAIQRDLPAFTGLGPWEQYDGFGQQILYGVLPFAGDHLIALNGSTRPLLSTYWSERARVAGSEPWQTTFERTFGRSVGEFYRSFDLFAAQLR
jgi:hypothetical protein